MADRERLVKTLLDLIRIDSPSGEEDAMALEVCTVIPERRDLGYEQPPGYPTWPVHGALSSVFSGGPNGNVVAPQVD